MGFFGNETKSVVEKIPHIWGIQAHRTPCLYMKNENYSSPADYPHENTGKTNFVYWILVHLFVRYACEAKLNRFRGFFFLANNWWHPEHAVQMNFYAILSFRFNHSIFQSIWMRLFSSFSYIFHSAIQSSSVWFWLHENEIFI